MESERGWALQTHGEAWEVHRGLGCAVWLLVGQELGLVSWW